MAVLKIDSGSGATTAGTVTIAAPSASTSTLLTCSAAQLAAAWVRPLDEIKVRVTHHGLELERCRLTGGEQ